jgi:hypothetical protein
MPLNGLPVAQHLKLQRKTGRIRFVTNFSKLNILLKHGMSPIFNFKDWGNWHDPFNAVGRRTYIRLSIVPKYGLLSHQTKLRCPKGNYHFILMGKIQTQIKTFTHGYQDCLVPDFFKTSCLSLSKIWNMFSQPSYLDDLLILTNSSFKDHLVKLEMLLARLSPMISWYEIGYLQI